MESNWKAFRLIFYLFLLTWTISGILGPMVREVAVDLWVESEAKIGLITSIFLVVASLMSFIWALLEDRFTRKYLLISAGIFTSVATLLTSFANSYFELFLFQMILAIGYAAILPIGYSITMDYISSEERAHAFALLGVASTIGIGFSYLLSGFLVDISWKIPFIVVAILFFIWSGFSFALENPKKGGKEKVLSDVISEGAIYTYHIKREYIRDLAKNKSNISIIAFNSLLGLSGGSVFYYLITMLKIDYQFSSIAATLFVVATYADNIVGKIFWGKRADKKFAESPDGKVVVILEALLIGPIFPIIAFSMEFLVSHIWLVLIFAILLAVGSLIISGVGAISTSILGEINPPELRATVFSINNFAQTIGRSIGIAIMGIFFNIFGRTIYLGFGIFLNLFGGGYHWGFLIMYLLYFVGILFILPLKKSVPIEISKLNEILEERAKRLEEERNL